jgi:hypothetical protein
MIARHVHETYVDGLKLEGRSGDVVLRLMLKEGFSCRLAAVSPIGLDEPPLTRCDRVGNEFGPHCRDVRVTARFRAAPDLRTQESLFHRLETARVVSTSVLCLSPQVVPPEFLAAKEAAERLYAERTARIARARSAREAFERLMIEGYYCGFSSRENDGRGLKKPDEIVCSLPNPGIRYCFKGLVVLSLKWSSEFRTFDEHFDALSSAEVSDLRSSCWIPSVASGGRKS